MKFYTLDMLKKYNGRNGNPSYIAFKGKIYDVSKSFLWKNGKHQALHSAGMDLTEALKKAPHGEDFIKRFPLIGYLKI